MVKWIFRYLRDTFKACLCFDGNKFVLQVYTNLNMAEDIDFKKSLSGYLPIFVGGAISWQCKLQQCVALSNTEADYIVITEG